MFDLLKKKISGFVEKLGGEGAPKAKEEKVEEREDVPSVKPPKEKVAKAGKKTSPKEKSEAKKEVSEPKEILEPEKVLKKKEEAKKGEEPGPVEAEKEIPEPKEVPEPEKVPKKKEESIPEKKAEEKVEAPGPKPVEEIPKKKKGLLEKLLGPKKEKVSEEKEKKKPEPAEIEKKPPVEREGGKPAPAEIEGKEPAKKIEEEKPSKISEIDEKKEAEKAERTKKKEEELKKKVKKGLFAAVTETITGESEIREEEIGELLDELELGMLESDVALSVAEEIKEDLRKRIIGSKVKRGQTAMFVKDSLNEILLNMFNEIPGFSMTEKIKEREKPCRIMVVGPNGAGKTTTIAKMVALLQNAGLSACVAASDTFRAAAVEQLVHHGNKLGVKVVHGAYGSDPTSIAFDAVNYAKANNLDVVIIDTAGRQETNVNLLNQLKKMDRIIKPEFKIYVGESIAGNAMVEQISRFNGDIGLDGVILTKLDCDAKGGTVISVSRVAKLPILYVGIGQGYDDLKPFVAKEIVGEILS